MKILAMALEKMKNLAGEPKHSSSTGSEADLLWKTHLWDDLDTGLPEVLPSELLGWLMLRRSGLIAQQRLNVLSAAGNDLRAETIERGWTNAEDELKLADVEHSHHRGKGKGSGKRPRSNFWVEQDGEWGSLAAEEEEVLDWLDQGQVHGIVKDISTV